MKRTHSVVTGASRFLAALAFLLSSPATLSAGYTIDTGASPSPLTGLWWNQNESGWGATLTQNFQLGYKEEDLVNGGLRRVGSYEIYDAQARWEGLRNVVVALGVRNIFDRGPPPSTQSSTFQIGYDPSYGDPRGRMFYGTIRVSFR